MLAIDLPQTRFLTLAATRRMSVEHPFADAQRGAAYGHKRGPAIALVGAVGSISAGISVVGAGSAFLGGVMIAGGIASGLGALTGNKTLANIGMGLSLAGGIGAAFVTPQGNFINPFAEGSSFSDTALGGGIAKMKAGVKSFFTDVTGNGTGVKLGFDGASVLDNAVPSVTQGSFIADAAQAAEPAGINLAGGAAAPGISLAGSAGANTVVGAATEAATGGGGLLASLSKNSGLLNAAGGAADAFLKYQGKEAEKPYYQALTRNANANANATNLQADQLQQRMNNMQAQPEVGLGVNPDANVYANQAPASTAGKVAVVMNGQVMYLSQAEYDAARQSNQAGGTGLLATGGVA